MDIVRLDSFGPLFEGKRKIRKRKRFRGLIPKTLMRKTLNGESVEASLMP